MKLHAVYKKLKLKDFNFNKLAKTISQHSTALILGSNRSSRYSYYSFKPLEIYNFGRDSSFNFEDVEKLFSKYSVEGFSFPEQMFSGGWAGYFSYDLGHQIEKFSTTTTDDLKMPLIHLGFYDKLIVYDRLEDVFYLISLAGDRSSLKALEDILMDSQKLPQQFYNCGEMEITPEALNCNMSKDEYFDAIKKIKQYIYDGDVYQINFSQRFETDFKASPIDLFNWQNVYNPSPYSAYLEFDDFFVVSTSPELFLQINNGNIVTKPIKGTRKYVLSDDKLNRKNYNDLLKCEKEQAELNMIIDLERNDIARICMPGTRKVIQSRSIEQYPTVYHALATVGGKLRIGVKFSEILKAAFPGGSITGAPKIRAMEIIDELEPTSRGLYTGSIGWISPNQNACLNIAIRTVIIKQNRAWFQTGGGIVSDSDAELEWQETLTKAAAMSAGIKALTS